MLKKEIAIARALLADARENKDEKLAVSLLDLIRKLEVSQSDLVKENVDKQRIEVVLVPELHALKEEQCG